MSLCSKLKNSLCKIVTKSQVDIKFNDTKSRSNCICQVNKLSYQTLSLENDGYFLNTQTVKNKNCSS